MQQCSADRPRMPCFGGHGISTQKIIHVHGGGESIDNVNLRVLLLAVHVNDDPGIEGISRSFNGVVQKHAHAWHRAGDNALLKQSGPEACR